MGADGGICWVLVKEPVANNKEKLCCLLPYSLLRWYDYHGDEHDQCLHMIPPNSIRGTYGTDHGDFGCLDDLDSILDERNEMMDVFGSQTFLKDVPELSKVLEMEGFQWPGPFTLQNILCREYEYSKDEPYLSMTLAEWYKEVLSCLQESTGRRVHKVQTWT